jgi:hypothetical protein
MLDPYIRRASRIRRLRRLLAVVPAFLVVATALAVTLLAGPSRSAATTSAGSSISAARAPATAGPVAAGPVPAPDCHKAVPWMQACARARHQVEPVPGPSQSPTLVHPGGSPRSAPQPAQALPAPERRTIAAPEYHRPHQQLAKQESAQARRLP